MLEFSNSGCGLKIVGNSIIKNSGSIGYNNRLKSQILKQEKYREVLLSGLENFNSPKIYDTYTKDELYFVEMEYIDGFNIIRELQNNIDVNKIADDLIKLITHFVETLYPTVIRFRISDTSPAVARI